MRKNLLFISILTLVFLAVCISCKSTPAASTSVPAAAGAEVEEARQRAVDFDAPAYFPSEWEAAEAHYSAEAWGPAKAAYDELFDKSIPLYAQAREDEIMAVREEIKASGLVNEFPEYLRNVDEIALEANKQYEAGEYYQAKDTAAKAMDEYSILLAGARAYQARQEIVDRGFIAYDQENFEKADEILLEAKAKYDSGDREGALASSEEALMHFNEVLESSWTYYARDRRTSAGRERGLALEEKANIASRDIFREADSLLNQAEDFMGRENFRNAGILFVDAEARFAIARKDTEEKRIRAEEAIRLAEDKIEESGGVANEAERIIEGGLR